MNANAEGPARPAGRVVFRHGGNGNTAVVTLACLPHAGGGVGTFAGWSQRFGPEALVAAAELSGRGSLINEPLHTSLHSLAEAATASLLALTPARPLILYGQSIGALIAFEIARELRRLQAPPPAALIVASQKAPHLCHGRDPIHALPDDQFIREVQRFEGMPPEVLENAELLELLLPSLRNDFALGETYRYRSEQPLNCPLVAFGGTRDPWISAHTLGGWRRHTSGRFTCHVLPGGHFFHQDPGSQFPELLQGELRTIAAMAQRSRSVSVRTAAGGPP